MNWDDVKLALAVARTGSLNQAAQLLAVNQSTVSRRLTALEIDLSVTLFKRSRQGLMPTDQGIAFIAKAAEIESQTEALVETMRQTDNRPVGAIRIVGNQWMVDHLLRSGLADFLEANPEVELRTITGRPNTSLWRGDPGIGLWFNTQPIDGALAIRLGTVPYAIYRKKGDTPHSWVGFQDEDNPTATSSLKSLTKLEEKATLRLTAVDATTIQEAIAAGIGQGYLPICCGLNDPRLERVTREAYDMSRDLYFHVHPDTLGTPRIEQFLAWIRAQFHSIFAPGLPLPAATPKTRRKNPTS